MSNTIKIPYLKIVEQIQQTPDAVAVLHKETKLTYAELHRLSNQVANYLRTLGVGPNTLVGIMTQRGPLMVIGILGILKAGGAYVPLDPSYPAERIRYILDHAKISTLLAESQVTSKLEECLDEKSLLHTLMFLDNKETFQERKELSLVDKNIWSLVSDEAPNYTNLPDDLMTVLYTSGSTGRPKGVMLNHRGYMNRLEWMQKTFQLKPGDRVAQKTSFCFDISVWELFWTLMEGATICPVERETVINPWEFAQWIKDTQINIMHFVPSLFGEFISALEDETWSFPHLRWLVFSGEALPLSFIQRWIDKYGMGTGLANLYGPTEASIDVTAHIMTQRPEENIPIGKAIDNVYIKILNEQMQPVAPGELGELWIGGIQLAKGYLNDVERTSAAFRPNPFSDIPGEHLYRTGDLAKELSDGSFEYHGRIDHQVKIRGFRVELGEIESVLNTHQSVREAAVLAVDYGSGQKRLVAWMSGQKVNNRQIKEHLSKQLPDYMIPQRLEWLPSLPKNHNGKLDRKALLALLPENRPTTEKAVTATDSSDEYLPLGSAQRWLVSYFQPPYQWTGYTRFLYHKPLNLEIFNKALNLMVARHPALRTVFVSVQGQWQQRVLAQPQPLTVIFHDRSHLTDKQRDEQIRNIIQQSSEKLQINEWPLMSTIVIKVSESCYDIAIVAHHIIADMLSTTVLFKELWYAYDQMLAGGNVSFENSSPLSYTDYVRLLVEQDKRGSLASHVDYWNSQFPSREYTFLVPFDHLKGSNDEASACSQTFVLTKEQTDALLRKAKPYYGCNVYTLLLAPLYQLMANWSNKSWVVVSHRTNGRDLGENHLFWESVGNYAVNFPVGIDVEHQNNWEQIIKNIKDGFDRLPMNGNTFDWICDRLPSHIYPDANLTPIRANYLGNRTLPVSEVFEFMAEDRDRRLSPPEQKRTTLLEFFFFTINGSLYLEIEYSRNFHLSETINKLGKQYLMLMADMLAAMYVEL
ncbi:amino acid adenylation domain-containing protein [Scytonema sp. UIC 10036]|uniref:non-ribosomal peptide synthetase n=1 Tax=Scytonema sp. UIC 10036 TaxID=2304196 RepID=UPI0012DA60D4|nr:amino acid adenylation domain-containing protein [Scytonema sp. UIC 10036]MUH00290.1 amino acid adenylation domain-containing protein [Scytonema sp. UIC 10036]